jgi:Skp family chaperone for outer membrane proteins
MMPDVIDTQPQDQGTQDTPVFDFVDPATKQKVKLPENVGDVNVKRLLEGVIKKSRNDVLSEVERKYQPILEQVQKYESDNSELREMLQKLEDEKLTADERAQKQFRREVETLKKQSETSAQKAAQYETLFKRTTEENSLVGEFSSRQDVHHARQAYMLMKSEFPIEVIESDGNYRVVVKMPSDTGDMEELDPKTAVERWLAMPDHRHFLKSSLTPGSGTSTSGGRMLPNGTLAYTRSDMADPKKRAEYFSKKSAGEKVELIDG